MDFVKDLFVLLHLVGMAAIVGGWIAVARAPKVIPPILWGARAQVLTGLILVGLLEATDETVNNAKIGVKLVVALAVAACAEIGNARQKRDEANPMLVNAAGGLALLNTAIAVLW
ncbi:hypothetical protein SAMN05216199_4034 [Pedococcus cremeus]|jgi:hypothetical protein|uniref:Integral membrane protein n=1 Tax=Pedococcus cremeus TaxID=587636 RepID=A0A1H9XNH6_9MICO|nr:hypothetical protein [Pedococcus cremeus]SES47233.1 hypothetical protein SAMN05216199_4034 [Pedococcus cremeus]